MPPTKRQKVSSDEEEGLDEKKVPINDRDSDSADEGDFGDDESGSEQSGSEGESPPDTEDEIAEAKRTKSKKTLKRKRRATDATHFGAALQSLLNTDAPSALPLSLKSSIARRKNDEKLEAKGKKVLQIERKEKEEKGRIKDVIGGWGGEGERALRKVAQRGVIKLFNVIQQAQAASAVAEENLKAQRGTGKPTLPAPSLTKGKKKGKQKDIRSASDALVNQDDFLNSIRSGGIVSKA